MTNRTLMVVGAHADDIELNTGGTLAKYRDRGYDVAYVMATNNMSGGWSRRKPDGSVETATPPYWEIMPQREREAAAGAKAFGTQPIYLGHPQRHYTRADGTMAELRYGCDRPDCVAPDVPTILTAYEHVPSLQRVVDLIVEHQPEAILTHGAAAANVEHFATSILVTKAYWQAVEAGHTGMLLHWPELDVKLYGPASYRWDTSVDVSAYWQEKLAAVALHACQIPDVSRLDFAAWGPTCGCAHAEVFIFIGGVQRPPLTAPFTIEIHKHMR